jgi:hypothetical protein
VAENQGIFDGFPQNFASLGRANAWADGASKESSRRYTFDMTNEHFQTTIRAFQRRTPFKGYVVELVSGDRVHVDRLEALVIRGGVVVFVDAAGSPAIFDHEGVSQIKVDSPESSAA